MLDTAISPIDLALSVAVGETFDVNGREFTRASYSLDGYADRVVLRAWNMAGNVVPVTVRETSRVEVYR